MTDKYQNRLHHLVVDLVYVAITFVLVAVNLGIGLWYYLYFTPAEIDVSVFTPTHITSGSSMPLTVVYDNPNRNIERVQIDVYFPKGFISENGGGPVSHFELGNVNKSDNGRLQTAGTVFGNVGDVYDARVATSYTYLGSRHTEVDVHRFTITESAFNVSLQFPETVTYGVPVEAIIAYENRTGVDNTSVEFQLDVPETFVMESASLNNATIDHDATTNRIRVPRIRANEAGSIIVRGYFKEDPTAVVGDQQLEVGVSILSGIPQPDSEILRITHGVRLAGLRIIAPRLEVRASGPEASMLGDTVRVQTIVKNSGNEAAGAVELIARTEGEAAASSGVRVLVGNNTLTPVLVNGEWHITALERLDAGSEQSVTWLFPTSSVDDAQPTMTAHVYGNAFIKDLNATVYMSETSWTTKFNSQVELSAQALYVGPNGEQIGFGPYPPKAWEVTSMRVVLRARNVNNALSTVRITATLPGQVEWTGSYSVSAGTSLSWNESTRTVEWIINRLEPQSAWYGAQFEIWFTPNHLQIGLQPHLVDSVVLSAIDAFTSARLNVSTEDVRSPAVVE